MTALPDNAELAAMLDRATPGPWRVVPVKGYTDDQIVTDHPDYQQKPHGNYIGETGFAAGHKRQNFSNDAALMVLSRELAEEVIRLRAGLTAQDHARALLASIGSHNASLEETLAWARAWRAMNPSRDEWYGLRDALRALAGDPS